MLLIRKQVRVAMIVALSTDLTSEIERRSYTIKNTGALCFSDKMERLKVTLLGLKKMMMNCKDQILSLNLMYRIVNGKRSAINLASDDEDFNIR